MVAKISSERNIKWDPNNYKINKSDFIINNQNEIKTVVIEEEKQREEEKYLNSSTDLQQKSNNNKGSDHIVLKPNMKVLYEFLIGECDNAIPRRTYKMIWIDEKVDNDENQVYNKVFLDLGFKNFQTINNFK